MEKIDLTTPYQPDPRQATALQVQRLDLNWEAQTILIKIEDKTTGVSQTLNYSGPTALSLMQTLNKVNLTTKSLHRRILERLVADGLLEGTISGSPD